MTQSIQDVAKLLAADGKGILAADESISTATKRLESVGVESTEDTRRAYRDLFLTAPGVEQYLSGVILYDETFWQTSVSGQTFVELLSSKGIMPGIKVDQSTEDFPNFPEEVFTKGLDDLPERLAKYAEAGATFTKWRSVITINESAPSDTVLEANANALAHYAALAQSAGLVPIIEPEVLFSGNHSLEEAEKVTTHTLKRVFQEMEEYKVDLTGLVLKSSMVLAGEQAPQSTPQEVAEATLRTFHASVPTSVPSIVFLSGGQTSKQAIENLQAIAQAGPHPWAITFSYARALQGPALEVWKGKEENLAAAQEVFLKSLADASNAAQGKYSA